MKKLLMRREELGMGRQGPAIWQLLIFWMICGTLIVGIAACAGTPTNVTEGLNYYHDDEHGVSCWRVRGIEGVSCLSDREIQ
jgi:hypothetical protein